jgi:hypothetical protein
MVEPDVFLESIYEEVLDIGMAASPVKEAMYVYSFPCCKKLFSSPAKAAASFMKFNKPYLFSLRYLPSGIYSSSPISQAQIQEAVGYIQAALREGKDGERRFELAGKKEKHAIYFHRRSIHYNDENYPLMTIRVMDCLSKARKREGVFFIYTDLSKKQKMLYMRSCKAKDTAIIFMNSFFNLSYFDFMVKEETDPRKILNLDKNFHLVFEVKKLMDQGVTKTIAAAQIAKNSCLSRNTLLYWFDHIEPFLKFDPAGLSSMIEAGLANHSFEPAVFKMKSNRMVVEIEVCSQNVSGQPFVYIIVRNLRSKNKPIVFYLVVFPEITVDKNRIVFGNSQITYACHSYYLSQPVARNNRLVKFLIRIHKSSLFDSFRAKSIKRKTFNPVTIELLPFYPLVLKYAVTEKNVFYAALKLLKSAKEVMPAVTMSQLFYPFFPEVRYILFQSLHLYLLVNDDVVYKNIEKMVAEPVKNYKVDIGGLIDITEDILDRLGSRTELKRQELISWIANGMQGFIRFTQPVLIGIFFSPVFKLFLSVTSHAERGRLERRFARCVKLSDDGSKNIDYAALKQLGLTVYHLAKDKDMDKDPKAVNRAVNVMANYFHLMLEDLYVPWTEFKILLHFIIMHSIDISNGPPMETDLESWIQHLQTFSFPNLSKVLKEKSFYLHNTVNCFYLKLDVNGKQPEIISGYDYARTVPSGTKNKAVFEWQEWGNKFMLFLRGKKVPEAIIDFVKVWYLGENASEQVPQEIGESLRDLIIEFASQRPHEFAALQDSFIPSSSSPLICVGYRKEDVGCINEILRPTSRVSRRTFLINYGPSPVDCGLYTAASPVTEENEKRQLSQFLKKSRQWIKQEPFYKAFIIMFGLDQLSKLFVSLFVPASPVYTRAMGNPIITYSIPVIGNWLSIVHIPHLKPFWVVRVKKRQNQKIEEEIRNRKK